MQCRDAVCKHLVASIQGSAVSPAITRCDPRVYVEVGRSFSLWAPGITYIIILQCVGVSCSNYFLSPAGNAGYSVLVSCSEKIVQSLSHEPKALAVRFLSVGLITERVLQETNQLNEINADKATRLYTALLGVVKHHPHKYHKFVSTLRLNPLHTDLVTQLDSKYM